MLVRYNIMGMCIPLLCATSGPSCYYADHLYWTVERRNAMVNNKSVIKDSQV